MAFFDGDDFNPLAIFQSSRQRHDLTIDLGATTAVAQIGVYRVGEVYGCGAHRQRQNFAMRREYVNGVVEQFGLEGLGQIAVLLVVGNIFAPFQQLSEPRNFLFVSLVAFAAFFVTPVRGHAKFGKLVHVKRANLNFHPFVFGANHDGVQALVIVGFGVGDVVVKLTRYRLPHAVDDAQGGIALRHGIHQHAHGTNVVQTRKIELFLGHFFVDGIDVLGAACHFTVNVEPAQFALNDAHHIVDVFHALGALLI